MTNILGTVSTLAAAAEVFSALCAGAVAALVFWPRHGLVARLRAARRFAERCHREDALKQMLKAEANGQAVEIEGLAGRLGLAPAGAAALIGDLERAGHATHDGGRLHLTPAGRDLARHVVRAHRLWESHLAEETGLSEAEWHARAEREEHRLSPEQVESLASRLGHPRRDPHGDFIPGPGGEIEREPGFSLNGLRPGESGRVVHVEDEPDAVYAGIAKRGIRPGMEIRVEGRAPGRLRVTVEGKPCELNALEAHNISVAPSEAAGGAAWESLAGLPVGGEARIVGLSPACRGPERRRLLDLGFVPGSVVAAELVSPAGDPTAYRIRSTTVALRREQADFVRVASRGAGGGR
jgi:DtxR family Mn-dependent transcriptional regulator